MNLSSNRRHVDNHHSRKTHVHLCRRCFQGFPTSLELETHIRLPPDQMCETREPLDILNDPEDGITPETSNILRGRKNLSKVASWRGLWTVLFPADKNIPSPGMFN